MINKMPSPCFDERAGESVRYLILHYTGMKTGKEALERLTSEESRVSAHYTVDEDGTVYHHVDERKRAWHSGQSYWQGRNDINTHSIGIEIINPGHEWGLRKFPAAQMKSVAFLCRDIMAHYDLAPEEVLGHSDISPARKKDPGELFPWRELALQGIGIWPDPSDEDVVKSASMHIERALHDYGYDPRVKLKENLIAFQRHYVPEAFSKGNAGEADSLTRKRLYALLAGHLLEPTPAS